MMTLLASKLSCVFLFVLGLFIFIHPQLTFAQTPACQTPAAVTGVTVTYPDCSGSTCSFTTAGCSWNSATNASTYQIVVTEVDTGTQVTKQSVNASTTKLTFPVTAGRTYKCDVTGVNSCGQSGGTGTDSLLCQVEGGTPIPTATPVVARPPQTNLPPTGIVENTIMVAGASLIFMIIGSIVLFRL